MSQETKIDTSWLVGKTAIVAGGASGIGLKLAALLAKAGAAVGILDIDSDKGGEALDIIQQEVGSDHVPVVFARCDVSDPVQFAEAIKFIKQQLAAQLGMNTWSFLDMGVDVWVNSAAIRANDGEFYTMGGSEEEWKKMWRVMQVDFNSVAIGTKAAMEEMRRMRQKDSKREGVVINIASMAGLIPLPWAPMYSAAKHAIVGFTRSTAVLAPEGLRINAVCPSYTDTPFVHSLYATADPAFVAAVKSLGPLMSVESVAEAIMQLIVDRNKSGAVMRITQWKGVDFVETPGHSGKKGGVKQGGVQQPAAKL
eukprot:GDKI01039729.1.p1 GENE.GDKI01039729.1~~GDKI01039729.1.p1  ORF type:complete len:310 (-),score=68.13 GDKI01039729.1:223-1152(-)